MVCVKGGSATMTLAQVAGVVASQGPPAGTSVEQWVAKAREENGGATIRPECINEIGAVGVWQVRDIHFATMQGRISSTFTDKATFRTWLQNPAQNYQAAKVVYDLQGWGAWSASGGKPHVTDAYRAAAGNPERKGGILGGIGGAATGAVDAAGNVIPGFGDLAAGLAAVVQALEQARKWVVDPHNWVRVAQVVAGVALGVGAVLLVARPVVTDVAGSTLGDVVKSANKGKS